MKSMRKKIGKAYYNNQEFLIWLDNSIVLDAITLKIYDDGNIPDYILQALNLYRKGNSRIESPILSYTIFNLEQVRVFLQSISSYLKAEIDFDKVEEFLHKIEKELVVERLS